MFRPYFLLFVLFCSTAYAAEETKEAEEDAPMEESVVVEPTREELMSKLIEKNLRSGEAIWLGNVDDAFLSLYKKDTSRKTQGGVLILHDLGANANWQQLVRPLRLKLAKKGWSTLSIQLPMVTPEAEKSTYLTHFDEAVARVGAGIEQLQSKNIKNIVIIGHGMGAAIGTFYLSQTPNAPVTALVTISLVGQDILMPEKKSEPEDALASTEQVTEEAAEATAEATAGGKAEEKPVEADEKLTSEPEEGTSSIEDEALPERELYAEMGKIEIPFFDIYAQQDHQDVLREVERRSEVMQKSENKNYSQWELEGADHYFRGHEAMLIKRLRGWLKKHAEGMVIAAP